jgi:phage baseplate assembly protein W
MKATVTSQGTIGSPSSAGSTTVKSPKYIKGFNTIDNNTRNFSVSDLECIKRDVLNHMKIRKGEKLMNPEFGTIIEDALYEPLTPRLKETMVNDINAVFDYDTRIRAEKIDIEEYENGLRINVTAVYTPYNVTEQLEFRFNRSASSPLY